MVTTSIRKKKNKSQSVSWMGTTKDKLFELILNWLAKTFSSVSQFLNSEHFPCLLQ